jgi:hypothetical protein
MDTLEWIICYANVVTAISYYVIAIVLIYFAINSKVSRVRTVFTELSFNILLTFTHIMICCIVFKISSFG